MKQATSDLKLPQIAVLLGTTALPAIWIWSNFEALISSQNGFIRFFMGLFLALLILFRPRKATTQFEAKHTRVPYIISTSVAGALGAVGGIVFGIHQFEWIGLILLMSASLRWALPSQFSRNALPAVFLLYWLHPLPSRLFYSFQTSMQKMSVLGSEWFLHMINVRVWADGLVLRTGLAVYEVPEWCSGMRTATTVFLLALGLTIIKRLRWHECAAIVVIAIAQALILNILRISAMVTLAPAVGQGSGIEFLHDTAGILVLSAVLIVFSEILFFEDLKRRRAAARQDLYPGRTDKLSEYPPFWRVLFGWKWLIALGTTGLLLIAGLVFKSRPYHRAHMIKDVADALRDTGQLEKAEEAAVIVQCLVPNDQEWNLNVLRILLMRQKFTEVLERVDDVLPQTHTAAMEKEILRAYAYMGLERLDKAAAIVERLPEEAKQKDPRVAMILAEMGMYSNDPVEVARNIITAASWRPNTARIRSLYPYLRVYREWEAIADSHSPLPYSNPGQALSATEAFMNLNRTPVVASLALQALNMWPDDPRVLEPLFFMAMKRWQGWEERFAAHLIRCTGFVDEPDILNTFFDKCFYLGRPDLAWLVYRKISEIDPSHPALSMRAAKDGNAWFAFRKRRLGIPAAADNDRIDLKPFYLLGKMLKSWQPLCEQIPLADQLAVTDVAGTRKRFLSMAIEEFARRDKANLLSLDMRYEYVAALEIADNVPDARRQLQRITELFPAEAPRTRAVLSEIYERKGDWQNVYETLRGHLEEDNPRLTALLRLSTSQFHLKLGLAALYTAQETRRLYPHAVQVVDILAAALLEYDTPEDALFALSRPRVRHQRSLDILEAESLYRTERFAEYRSFCRSALLPSATITETTPQTMFLPPAELSVLWHHVSIPPEKDFEATAASLKKNLEIATSPFFRRMMPLWLECHESRCAGTTADIKRWLSCGRDDIEKAIALNQLTLLLCREQKFSEARSVALAATKLFPQSPTLWRILLSLSVADPAVINAAHKACPDDSEIWLASLVVKTYGNNGVSEYRSEKEVIDHLNTVVNADKPLYSPAAMTRAGEYLFRGGMRKAAAMALRDATARARGLLPAYVAGAKSALAENDSEWALECTRKAIEASVNPPTLFYQTLVDLKSEGEIPAVDSEMLNALRNLRRDDPDNPLWAQMLGFIRFKRGGWEVVDAMYQMNEALDGGATNIIPYVVSAEAARLLGNTDKALETLQRGLEKHPGNLAMLNNLAYAASLNAETVPNALSLVPELLERAKGDVHILDTIAHVYLRAGQFDNSEAVLKQILAGQEKGSPAWFRARMRQADMQLCRAGTLNESETGTALKRAQAILADAFRNSTNIPDEDILTANKLLAEIETRLQEQKTK